MRGTEDLRRRPILVVEDSLDDLDTIERAARGAAVKNPLVHAPDAGAALRLLAEPREDYALVLLDHNLPGMDGCDLLKEIRSTPRWHGLPVIVFTTNMSPRARKLYYEAGANACHIKAVRYEECLATLDAMFRYWLAVAVLPELHHDVA